MEVRAPHHIQGILSLLGLEGYHTDPILKMMMEVQEEVLKHRRKQTGQKGRPPENRTLGMAIAAAAGTALSDSRREPHMTVSDAITDMAKKSGIPKAEIKTFRDNVSRGKVGAECGAVSKHPPKICILAEGRNFARRGPPIPSRYLTEFNNTPNPSIDWRPNLKGTRNVRHQSIPASSSGARPPRRVRHELMALAQE